MSMRDIGKQVRQLADKYIWWQEPDGASRDARLIAQVMELGTHEDVEIVREAVGDDQLPDDAKKRLIQAASEVRRVAPVRIASTHLSAN